MEASRCGPNGAIPHVHLHVVVLLLKLWTGEEPVQTLPQPLVVLIARNKTVLRVELHHVYFRIAEVHLFVIFVFTCP